jgi:uroporphyrinogen-III synthase
MSRLVLVLRPRPGADGTAARARALGLEPVVAPLFSVHALDWTPPPAAAVGAVILTSANGALLAGDAMASFTGLPCYAVGEASAAAAAEAGFGDVRVGPSDGAALLALMAADGVRSAFHPCGREHLPLKRAGISLIHVPVYAAEAVERLPEAADEALRRGAVALVHSPRAGALLASLLGSDRDGVSIAAISADAAQAAGDGWRSVAVAPKPRDEALLELVAKLCQTEGRE